MQDAGLMVDQPELWLGRCKVNNGASSFKQPRSPYRRFSADAVSVFTLLNLYYCETLEAHISSSRAPRTCHLPKPAAILGSELGPASAH
jgi:hypothetical protein